jgi:hypothetical protein
LENLGRVKEKNLEFYTKLRGKCNTLKDALWFIVDHAEEILNMEKTSYKAPYWLKNMLGAASHNKRRRLCW